MADLSDKDSAQSVKLVGANASTGIETNYIDATANGLKVDGSAVTQPVSGPLTDAELRASPVAISGSISATNPSVSTTGTAIPASATLIGGSDGTNLRAAKVSATGVLSVDGSATTQPISASSLPLPTGAATAALQTQPGVDIGDVTVNNASGASAVNIQDGGNSITVDGTVAATQSGTWTVQPGNTANTTPWLTTINQGGNSAIVSTNSEESLSSAGLVVRSLPFMPETFSVSARAVAIGNGKSMLSLFNTGGSSVIIRLQELKIYNVQSTSVTGVMAEFGLRKITAHSSGTELTTTGAAAGLIFPYDSANSLNSSVTVRTGATVTENPAFDIERWKWSSDEFGPGTADAETTEHTSAQLIAAWKAFENGQPLTLRAGEGLHIRQATNSTAGTFDLVMKFTQGVT